MEVPHYYHIDVASGCNLKCAFCAVSNFPEAKRPSGMMSFDLFAEIVKKIKSDADGNVEGIGLFNWTEPLLHPQLARIVRHARNEGIPVDLASNLNVHKNLREVIAAGPRIFRVTLSGFSQETYSQNHVRGSIERVKENLIRLREALDESRNLTKSHVTYLCYVDNMGTEYESMQRFCGGLDFSIAPVWAYLTPVEKQITYYEGKMTEQEVACLDRLLVHPDRAREISLRHPIADCPLRSRQTAINANGSVAVCCGAYDSRHDVAPSFLDSTYEQMQEAKYTNPLCKGCFKHGVNVTIMHGGPKERNAAVAERIRPQKLPKKLRRRVFSRFQMRRVLRKLRMIR